MSRQVRQRGSTLIVSLIFLLIFLVMALSIFRGALTSSQAIGNMQWRNEAIAAANEAIDRLLSASDIATSPQVVTQQVNAVTPLLTYDFDGDGTTDATVRFPQVARDDGTTRAGPRCLRVAPIPASQLDPDQAEDAGCFASAGAGGIAVEGSGGGASAFAGSSSLCSNSEWSLTVQAADPRTNTRVDVVQGYAVRVVSVAVETCD